MGLIGINFAYKLRSHNFIYSELDKILLLNAPTKDYDELRAGRNAPPTRSQRFLPAQTSIPAHKTHKALGDKKLLITGRRYSARLSEVRKLRVE